MNILPFPDEPVPPPKFSVEGCATYYPSAVRIAISDWQKLFDVRQSEYIRLEERLNDREVAFNERPTEMEEREHRSKARPDTDDGRKDLLLELKERYHVSFQDWQIDEMEIFARVSYPLNLLAKITTDGKPSIYFRLLRHLWQPSLRDWLEFLYLFVCRAREFFADLLFLDRENLANEWIDVGTVLFHDLLEDGVYTIDACPSIVGALIPFPMECFYARRHAAEMIRLSSHLGPETLGLVVRSLLIHRCHRPSNPRACGYRPNEAACVCSNVLEGTRLPQGLESDVEMEYACVLLSLLIGREGENQGLKYVGKWPQNHIDTLIIECCDKIFTESTFLTIYASLNNGEKAPRTPMFPRKRTQNEIHENDYRVTTDDFDNAFFQTGACVVRNCKQIMKLNCENAACKTHCKDGYAICRVHREYSVKTRPDAPERPCVVDLGVKREEKRVKLMPRDRDNI